MAAGIVDARCGFFRGRIIKEENKRGSALARSLSYWLARLYYRAGIAVNQHFARTGSRSHVFIVRFVDEC